MHGRTSEIEAEMNENPNKPWSITHSNIEIPNGKSSSPERKVKQPERSKKNEARAPNPEWNKDLSPDTVKSSQGDLVVTSVRQNNELQLVKDVEVARAEGQSSRQWLESHSLVSLKLTVDDILSQGIPIKPAASANHVCQHLKLYNSVLDEYESEIKRFLTICQERIRWLLRDSRRAFGLITGSNPCILLDVSDTNTGFGRLKLIQNSLKKFVDEQLVKAEKLYVCSFGTTVQPLWGTLRDVNCRIIDEMHHWIDCLQPDGRCNVMSAVRHVIKRKGIDSVILILGNCPDQNPQTIIDYIDESIVGRSLPFHTVAYNCSMSATNMFLEELANKTKGRYHCFSTTSEAEIMSGTDLKYLSLEVKRAVQVLSQIQDMRNGTAVENKIISIADQPRLDIEVITTVVPKVDQHKRDDDDTPKLVVEAPSFPVRTSKEWLSEHGLKEKGLTLYQVMSPNAFNYIHGYVSSINRSVVSQVHHRSMIQLQWHDGSTKNVHVDPIVLSGYQHHLDMIIQLYRRRMEWLASGSRSLFGTLVEQRIVLLVDMSLAMSGDILHLHDDMRSLLEQQVPNKRLFNIICFGANVTSFQTKMVEPSIENLDNAFRWFIRQPCSGSRKFMGAFRHAMENEEEQKTRIEPDGVYLITSGIPDEPVDAACSFVQEAFAGREAAFHCIYYEPSGQGLVPVAGRYADVETTTSYLKQLAHCSKGRFHWVKENDVLESDDARLVSDEMEKAYNYKKKTETLLASLKKKYSNGESVEQSAVSNEIVPKPPSALKKRIGPPRQTALSKARINGVRPSSAVVPAPTSKKTRSRPHSAAASKDDLKMLAWKPSTASSSSNLIPPLPSASEELASCQLKTLKNHIIAEQQTFYTEIGNNTGYVFRSYQMPHNPVSKKKLLLPSDIIIPEEEDNVTTREWLRKYSLVRLKLDLNSIVNTTECLHSQSKVSTIGKTVTAKHCEIFPTITINGAKKHLHLQPRELEEYGDQLERTLKRYVKRLQWLLSGSRRVFGSIVEKNVILLVDVSGSMVTCIDELKMALESILWQQINKHRINFSIMKFSTNPELWSSSLAEPDDQVCKQAIEWISEIEAYGGTCTIDALRLAFQVEGLEAIYLLSDGKPDTSTSSVLREVATLCASKKLKIHTISFNCEDSVANRFLQLLASQTGGRYHRYQERPGMEISAYKLLSKNYGDENYDKIPMFEGDDASRLVKEIKLCRQYLYQARSFREVHLSHSTNSARQANRITVKDFPSMSTQKTLTEVT